MPDDLHEAELADAIARVQDLRARGEEPDLQPFRDRLGSSQHEFENLLEVDALIDEATDPAPSERLPRDFGKYRLLRVLGQGAVGVVYEALDTTLDRKAAVKVLRAGFESDAEARKRFRIEARATAQVRHEHIVEIFDAAEIDGRPFYAMALVEGRPLSALIAAHEVPPLRDLCRELAGIADALNALHHATPAAIIHRDVKPSNIMVRPDGRMILADFGLALASDGIVLTQTGVAVGTPLYMPPEQMQGHRAEIDARADVYALGATLYEAVAGKPIFPPATLATLARQVISERPASLRHAAPDCPPSIERIAMMALEKRREDRYQTAASIRDDLLLVAKGSDADVRGEPVGVIRRYARWSRTPAGLSTATAILLLIGVGIWWTHRPARLIVRVRPLGAEVIVDGVIAGKSPMAMMLPPGTHNIQFHHELFHDSTSPPRRVSAGADIWVDDTLFPRFPVTTRTIQLIALAIDSDPSGLKFDPDRSSGTPMALIHPRENVRLSDLDRCRVELDLDLAEELGRTGALIHFRHGDSVSTWELAKALTEGVNEFLIPPGIQSGLRIGDVVEWSITSSNASLRKHPPTAMFTVVDADVDSAITGVDQQLKSFSADGSSLPKELVDEMKIRTLWKLGLKSLAVIWADQLADGHPSDARLQALARIAHVKISVRTSSRISQLSARIPEASGTDSPPNSIDGWDEPSLSHESSH